MRVPWEKSGNAAQIFVAIVAFVSLLLTAYQSRKTAELLSHARDAFVAQSVPLVKFDSHQWVTTPEGFGCAKPVHGINVYYRNFSGVPVAIEHADLEIKRGDRPLLQGPPEVDDPMKGETILPPGVKTATGWRGEHIQKAYPLLQGEDSPPYINFDVQVTFRSLVSGKRYRYTGNVILYEDCRLPAQTNFAVGQERIDEISVR
jgi:hypothetical protein